MGGFFGITSKQDCMMDVFFGVDYHSHLGTRRGGIAIYDKNNGFQRQIQYAVSFRDGSEKAAHYAKNSSFSFMGSIYSPSL